MPLVKTVFLYDVLFGTSPQREDVEGTFSTHSNLCEGCLNSCNRLSIERSHLYVLFGVEDMPKDWKGYVPTEVAESTCDVETAEAVPESE